MGMVLTVPRYTTAELDEFPSDGNRYERLDGMPMVTSDRARRALRRVALRNGVAMKMSVGRLAILLGSCAALACARPAATLSPSAARRDLFLLAGQSNMAGRGTVEPEDRVVVTGLMMLDRAMDWVPAADPVHYDKPIAGVGPGRAFAIAVRSEDTARDIGLVPAAVGGSPISSWEPGALDVATKTHPYDDAIARARAARQDGQFRAILWHQGESDATPDRSVLYAQRLRTLITRLRAELGDPALPFIIGQLGQFPRANWSVAKVRVDSAQRAIAETMPGVAFVSSDGLRHRGDSTHFDSRSARELGRRYAAAYLSLVHR